MTAEQRRAMVEEVAQAEARRARGRRDGLDNAEELGRAELQGISRTLYAWVGRDKAEAILQAGWIQYRDGSK